MTTVYKGAVVTYVKLQQSSHLLLSVDFLIPRSKLEAVLHVEVEKDYEADELMGERGAVP